MTQLILATHNDHKAKEFRDILPQYSVQTLADLGHDDEIKETATSLEGNSFIKAETVFKRYGNVVISDDSGLEVDALNGDPGLYTARYAGNKATYEDNMQKLLQNLEGIESHLRTARFRTIISYVDGINDFHVEGVLEGKITKSKVGSNGFGYDPIFFSEKFNMTLAQMNNEQKNNISHRGLAIKKFVTKIRDL